MTRVSVAHRPDISAGADRVIRIAKTVQSEARMPAILEIAADHRVVAASESKCLTSPAEPDYGGGV
jgi:hypothetical protein